MIYVEHFTCTPDQLQQGNSDIDLRFKANGQNNLLLTPVTITYSFPDVPAGATALWVSSQTGTIQDGGNELIIRDNFPDYLAGFKYKATVQLNGFSPGNSVEVLMHAVDQHDGDIEDDGADITLL